jgi:hypothetical protein
VSADDWKARHEQALRAPTPGTHEAALVGMFGAWVAYAEAHRRAYDSPIGDDGVLGDEWRAIGHGLLGLLNGDLGRLDGGSMDRAIRTVLEHAGCEVG